MQKKITKTLQAMKLRYLEKYSDVGREDDDWQIVTLKGDIDRNDRNMYWKLS